MNCIINFWRVVLEHASAKYYLTYRGVRSFYVTTTTNSKCIRGTSTRQEIKSWHGYRNQTFTHNCRRWQKTKTKAWQLKRTLNSRAFLFVSPRASHWTRQAQGFIYHDGLRRRMLCVNMTRHGLNDSGLLVFVAVSARSMILRSVFLSFAFRLFSRISIVHFFCNEGKNLRKYFILTPVGFCFVSQARGRYPGCVRN